MSENQLKSITLLTANEEETALLGQKLADCLQPGDVVVLHGDLGMGKSVLARGIARGMGITGPVPSPSFTILNVYENGRLPIYHFDWYRIEDPDELSVMGVEEQLNGNGICLIEWAERAPEMLPDGFLLIKLTKCETGRQIQLYSVGLFRSLHQFHLN